jgi:hypothetical protein
MESLAAERLFQPDYWDELVKEGRWAYFDYKYMQVSTVRLLGVLGLRNIMETVLSENKGCGFAFVSDLDSPC